MRFGKKRLPFSTGPNGYGKTTVLRIIHALASNDLVFFFQLPFSGIMITVGNDSIRLSKSQNTISVQSGSNEPVSYNIEDTLSDEDFVDLEPISIG